MGKYGQELADRYLAEYAGIISDRLSDAGHFEAAAFVVEEFIAAHDVESDQS